MYSLFIADRIENKFANTSRDKNFLLYKCGSCIIYKVSSPPHSTVPFLILGLEAYAKVC